MRTRTMVAVTTEESSPGVPHWGTNQVITELPVGETEVAIENLVAGRTYYVKTWNEDPFGNKSPELLRVVQSKVPTRTVPYSFSAQGVLDDGSAMRAFVKVPANVKSVTSAAVTLSFREFFASAQEAASAGVLTSNSGGGSTSGSSSTSSSTSDLTGLTFDSADSDHTHTDPQGGSTGASQIPPGGGINGGLVLTGVNGTGNHNHGISHTHSTPNHQHTIPAHDHDLVYGTFEETYPASHDVIVRLYKRESSSWTLLATESNLTDDLVDLDFVDYITGPGDYRLEVQSDTGQPNDGRLGCDLYGALEVII